MWQHREGGEEKYKGEKESTAVEGTAIAAERNLISDRVKGYLPPQEQSHKTEWGDWGR